MGSLERKERLKQELKQTILKVARKIAEREGWDKVTIRHIADEIEYSPPTIYEFFKNKEDLLNELAREGFRLLLADLLKANLREDDARAKCLHVAKCYWNFAQKHPALYQVIYGTKKTDSHFNTNLEEAQAVFDIMQSTFHEAVAGSKFPQRSHYDLLDTIWGLLHGLIVLDSEGAIIGEPGRASQLMEQAVTDLLSVWLT
jgi:AcrR family transcriptional regulator